MHNKIHNVVRYNDRFDDSRQNHLGTAMLFTTVVETANIHQNCHIIYESIVKTAPGHIYIYVHTLKCLVNIFRVCDISCI